MGMVSSLSSHTSLECLLENLKLLYLAPYLKGPKFVFSIKICPRYPLDNQSKWLWNSTLDPNIIQDLYNYGKWLGTRKESLC